MNFKIYEVVEAQNLHIQGLPILLRDVKAILGNLVTLSKRSGEGQSRRKEMFMTGHIIEHFLSLCEALGFIPING